VFYNFKQIFLKWLDELANFMDPDTYNLFEPLSEKRSDVAEEDVVALKKSVKVPVAEGN